MSSILTALKKLEQDKAARIPTPLDLGSDIVRPASSRPVRTSHRTISLLLAFACGAGLAYLHAMRGPAIVPHGPAAQQSQPHPRETGQTVPLAAPVQPRPAAHGATIVTPPSSHAQKGPTLPATDAQPGRPAPRLSVDGIAYHMESAESLAIVNGVTVYVGAVVEGARVEEIGKDRIRFSYGGERFEVPLGASNR